MMYEWDKKKIREVAFNSSIDCLTHRRHGRSEPPAAHVLASLPPTRLDFDLSNIHPLLPSSISEAVCVCAVGDGGDRVGTGEILGSGLCSSP